MTIIEENIESIIDVPSESKRARPQVQGARLDDSIAGYDTLTPIEVHTADGRIFHTSLAKLGELMETLRAERKE